MSVTLSVEFAEKVRVKWDSGPECIVWLAKDQAWELEVHGEDHDDQIHTTVELGVLVGRTYSQGPDAFLEAFQGWVSDNS